MKKSELKRVIKPLVKECIQEVLLEEGLLSKVVSEVVKGMGAQQIVESPKPQSKRIVKENKSLDEQRRKMMDAVNSSAYNGVDLFEGTDPLTAREPKPGSIDLGDPRDPGVDISSIMGNSSEIWKAMK